MTRARLVVLTGLLTAVVLAGCGSSSKPGQLPSVKTAALVACLKRGGADPVRLSTSQATAEYFEPVNNVKPATVYRLKNGLLVGIFDTQNHAHSFSLGDSGELGGGKLSAQFQERNVVIDDPTKKLTAARSQADQTRITRCLPS